MILFLLRHEKAQPRSDRIQDEQRSLVAKGKVRAQRRAKKFRKKLQDLDLILTSPHTRAFETATAFAEELNKIGLVKSDVQLVASADARSILSHLFTQYSDQKSFMVVGHGPWLNDLVSLLISGSYQCKIKLKIGSLTRLEVETLQPHGAVISGLW